MAFILASNLNIKAMKIKLIIIIFITGFISVNAQNNPDAITGKWLNHTKDATIEIYELEGKYYGKIIWLKEPNDKHGNPIKDKKNSDSELRDRELLGLQVLSGLEFNKEKWENGKIYSKDRGRTARCSAYLKNTDVLNIDIETRFFTKTIQWTKL